MGFDASVISGVVGFIEVEFALTKIQVGWSVASLTLTATAAMMIAGPLSDRLGRRPVLSLAAALFAVSAIASALAPNFIVLVAARMLGGFGVGAALIVAPMYIAELAPPAVRGRMVSFNQLNIVIGISAAFFSNYLVLRLGQSDNSIAEMLRIGEWSWRWMLGIETLPAVLYWLALRYVPESPRWLAIHGDDKGALQVLGRTGARGEEALAAIKATLAKDGNQDTGSIRQLFQPAMKLVITIGIVIAILQQITGINSVFFYAPLIFEQSGIGTNAAFMQAVLVGIVNLAFTVLALFLIDRLGRRPLLGIGISGIVVCMLILAWGFGSATYTLSDAAIETLPADVDRAAIQTLAGTSFDSDVRFRNAVAATIGVDVLRQHESQLVSAAINVDSGLILFGILGFVASFAISLGPVMWVLFSELFPNRLRGLAISFVGLINSGVSFLVQLVFPWELASLGNAATFLIYGVFALLGLIIIMRLLPETKGRSLEELENILVRN